MSRRSAAPRVYLVTDRHATGGRPLVETVERALQGGADTVQLRDKDLPTNQLYATALRLREATRRHDAKLLINDRIDIAIAVDADGVHLPAASFAIADARTLLGDQRLIAVSTHSLEEARAADRAGADFVVFGPIFETPSKRSYGPPQGLAKLEEVVRSVKVPVVAIGGIDQTNAAEVYATGARGVAAIRAILSAPDPADVARSMLAAD